VRVLQQLVRRPGASGAGSAVAWNDLGDSLGDALQFNDAIQGAVPLAHALSLPFHELNICRSI